MLIDIYHIPLINGNFDKETYRKTTQSYKKNNHHCGNFEVTETSTFRDIFELPEVASKLEHLSDIEKMVSVHSRLFSNYSHGPSSLMVSVNSKLRLEEKEDKELYIVYPSIEDMNKILQPPHLEMNENTPIIFLDFDGVVNEFNSNNSILPVIKLMSKFHSFNVKYDPEKVKRINEWSNFAEIRFLTSWNHAAEFRVAPNIGLYSFSHHYKFKYDFDLNEEDCKRPIIWIDDELSYTYCLDNAIKLLASKTKKVTLIAPESELSETQMNIVEDIIYNKSDRCYTQKDYRFNIQKLTNIDGWKCY